LPKPFVNRMNLREVMRNERFWRSA
jgi:hypothetical protein